MVEAGRIEPPTGFAPPIIEKVLDSPAKSMNFSDFPEDQGGPKTAGPAIAGRIFDTTGSYFGAWVLFMAMALASALAMRATLPLRQETSRIAEQRYDVA